MGSVGALVDIELGSASQSEHFGLACTDLACFFYSLQGLVPGLERLCVLEGVEISQVRANLRELAGMPARLAAMPELAPAHAAFIKRYGEGYAERAQRALDSWPAGATDLGCTAPPMGFSWSPFIAQAASSFLAHTACPQSLHVVHKGNMRKMEGSAVITYLDDLACICRGATERLAAQSADATLHALKQTADKFGLLSHKDQVGSDVIELGIRLQAKNGTVIATPEPRKFCLLLHAVEFLLKCKFVKKQAFLSVLGHFAWVLQLQRPQYACLAECYNAVITTSNRVEISADVRWELRCLLRLAPLLRADLGAAVCGTLYMVDAGPEGGAVVLTSLKGEKYSTDVDLENYPRSAWKMGPCATWTKVEHNNLTEARCNIWALQHAARSEAGRATRAKGSSRPLRVIVYTDSLVALGSFMKGRSSSRALNRYCRRQAALAALFGIVPLLRYVPTDRNLADGPSRGLCFPCVHVDTVKKAEVKAARRAAGREEAVIDLERGDTNRPLVDLSSPASSRCGSVSDGSYHLQKSTIGDKLGFIRHWEKPPAEKRHLLWDVDLEVGRVLALERSIRCGARKRWSKKR
jgi:hypothetical protein